MSFLKRRPSNYRREVKNDRIFPTFYFVVGRIQEKGGKGNPRLAAKEIIETSSLFETHSHFRRLKEADFRKMKPFLTNLSSSRVFRKLSSLNIFGDVNGNRDFVQSPIPEGKSHTRTLIAVNIGDNLLSGCHPVLVSKCGPRSLSRFALEITTATVLVLRKIVFIARHPRFIPGVTKRTANPPPAKRLASPNLFSALEL